MITLAAVPASATSAAGAAYPPQFTGLTATAESSTEVDLSWTAPPPTVGQPDGYNVYDGTSPDVSGLSGPVNGADLITGTSFPVTGLNPGTTYYFAVTELEPDADGGEAESDRSTAVQATTPTAGPASPTGLTARVVSNSEVDLSWTAPSSTTPPTVAAPASVRASAVLAGKYVHDGPAGGYDVYQGTRSGGESLRASAVGGTTFQATGLNPGTTYYFEVTAVDAAGGESSRSNEVPATTTGVQPTTPLTSPRVSASPTGLTARAVSESEVDLSWTAPSGGAPTGYYIYDGTSSNGESGRVNADPVTGTTFQVTGLHGGTTYYFKVTAVDAGKETGFSNEAQATTLTTPTPVPAAGPPWAVLGGLAVIVVAVGVLVWRRLHPKWRPDSVIKAVPHAGPPLAKSIRATRTGARHTVRIESDPGMSNTTMEEVRPR